MLLKIVLMRKKKITTHGQGKPCVVIKVVTSTTQGELVGPVGLEPTTKGL